MYIFVLFEFGQCVIIILYDNVIYQQMNISVNLLSKNVGSQLLDN